MSLSSGTAKRMLIALTSQNAGNEVVTLLNDCAAEVGQAAFTVPAIVVAAHTSTTTDFAALKVGDYVLHIPAVAGNSIFYTVATAGTLPAAAVVGDMYVVVRSLVLPAAANYKL